MKRVIATALVLLGAGFAACYQDDAVLQIATDEADAHNYRAHEFGDWMFVAKTVRLKSEPTYADLCQFSVGCSTLSMTRTSIGTRVDSSLSPTS